MKNPNIKIIGDRYRITVTLANGKTRTCNAIWGGEQAGWQKSKHTGQVIEWVHNPIGSNKRPRKIIKKGLPAVSITLDASQALGPQLKKARIISGLSQTEVSRRMQQYGSKSDSAHIHKVEMGTWDPKDDFIINYGKVIGLKKITIIKTLEIL